MGEKLVIGPINKGLKLDREPFVIDNDSFPTLQNAYQWRGRVKRKRGTSLLNRLQRYINTNSISYIPATNSTITLSSTGQGNLLTGFGLQPNGSIIPGSVTITDTMSAAVYTDPSMDGTLSPSGTINYATGEITILASANDPVRAVFRYYPALPVMGLEDLNLSAVQFPGNLAFDTTYAYNIVSSSPYTIYDVSFYKNPATGTYPSYVQKTNPTPLKWNGQNYQQFWAVDYENALWATNGINIPFVGTNVGMQFKPIVTTTTILPGPPATVNLNIVAHGLVVGDFVFINEVQNITGINFQSGYVIAVTDANNVIVELPNATLSSGVTATITGATQANPAVLTAVNTFVVGQRILITGVVGMTQLNGNIYTVSAGTTGTHITLNVDSSAFGAYVSGGTAILETGSGGIAQYLTSSADSTKDCMRWYDGDPTNGTFTSPTLNQITGWVNFSPPISNAPFSIGDLPALEYYLVTARMVIQFKDRLLFLGPVVQSATTGPFYLQDTIIYSQNGTPYYTASFTGEVTSSATIYHPILTPQISTSVQQSAAPNSYFSDLEGYGGFITAGFSQPIVTVSTNQDVLVIGFTNQKTKLVYSGNDLIPFNFYIVNSEYGDASTFSVINLDRGVYAVGDRGITITNQVQSERIDLEIPDQVFQFNLLNNGPQRTTAQRDFINEWVYFTYTSNEFSSTFPNQTLLYNYRDDSWGIFNESYTTYGQMRRLTGDTWATIGEKYPTWESWTVPWNAGSTTLLQPQIIAGNQQGFVMIRESDTNEGNSLYISDFTFPSTITGATQANPAVLTAVNSFIAGQLVTITGVVGMTQLNGNTYVISAATPTTITIVVDSTGFGAYVSGGLATPSNTVYSPNHGLNNGDYIVISGCLGTISSEVNGGIFSVYGITPADLNSFSIEPSIDPGTYLGGGLIKRMYVPLIQTKQFPVAWDMARKTRIGPQMYLFTRTAAGQVELQMYLSQDINNPYNSPPIVPSAGSSNNSLIYSDILFTSPIPDNLQTPTASRQAQLWQRMNTSLIGDTVQLGITLNDAQMRNTDFDNQFVEIELHSIVMDINPSSMLC